MLIGNTNYFQLVVFHSQGEPKLGLISHQKKAETLFLLASFFKF